MTTYTLLYALLRTTLVLTFCGGICFLALRKFEHHLPKLSRLLWVAVLLTGWFWLQPVIEIPTTHESRERNNVERPDFFSNAVIPAQAGIQRDDAVLLHTLSSETTRLDSRLGSVF